ncbi:MAG: sigma-70 family RNA polymerase sigma factor [Pirellulaceae bacterium]
MDAKQDSDSLAETTESALLERAKAGDTAAVGKLFDRHRDRLKRLVQLRLDSRLARRLDPSDVLQDVYVDLHTRIVEYETSDLPFFLWLRLKVGHRLVDLHRYHLGAQKRDAGREISLHRGPIPLASTASLASQLMGRLTSASNAVVRAENRLRVQDALNSMDTIDREVLVLRHFEDLTNSEVATVLAISQKAASNRYVRALRRLRAALTPQ